MRRPISQIIRWLKDQKEIQLEDDDEQIGDEGVAVRKRKLVVVIDKASSLPKSSASVVYYSIDNKDFFTTTQPGSNPQWNYRKVHDINYNQEFTAMMK